MKMSKGGIFMKQRKFLLALLVCAVIIGCLPIPANATEIPDKNIIWLDDLEGEWIDLSTVEQPNDGPQPRTTVSANGTYSAHSIWAAGQPINFNANDLITFNCSYSPSSASVDFGVIAPNGRFYYINIKEGSIKQSIEVSQSGSYTVAIRNNSSQTVRVVGFVDY